MPFAKPLTPLLLLLLDVAVFGVDADDVVELVFDGLDEGLNCDLELEDECKLGMEDKGAFIRFD